MSSGSQKIEDISVADGVTGGVGVEDNAGAGDAVGDGVGDGVDDRVGAGDVARDAVVAGLGGVICCSCCCCAGGVAGRC